MITEKRENEVYAELEKVYLEHGDTSQYYDLVTRYEDLEQYVAQVDKELWEIDNSTDYFTSREQDYDYLKNLLADLKKIVLRYNPEYFGADTDED